MWKTWGDAIQDVRFTLRKVRGDGGDCHLNSNGKEDGVRSEASGRTERSRRRHKWKHAHNHHHHSSKKDSINHKDKDSLHSRKLARDDPKFW